MKYPFPALSRRFSSFAFVVAFSAGLALITPAQAAGDCRTVQFPVMARVAVHAVVYDEKVADVNGDGNLDLMILADSGLFISLGNGAGQFRAPVEYDAGVFSTIIALGDFNGDDFPDAVVADFPGISILLNDGAGGFFTAEFINTGEEPLGLAVADFNRDGKLDVAVADFQANSISFLAGDGTGGFAAPVSFATGRQPTRLVAGDFNGDGVLDLAAAEYGSMDLRIFKGRGDGHFGAGPVYPLGGNADGLVTADFNNDGKLDLAVDVFNVFPNNHVEVFLGNGNGSFTDSGSILANVFESLVAADLNDDGNMDLAFTDSVEDALDVALGDGTGGFGTVQMTPFPGKQGYAFGIDAGDLNGDGTLDLATGNNRSHDSTIFFNAPKVSLAAAARPASEDGTKGKFTVTRRGCDTSALTVFYRVGGTATPGVDYKALTGRVRIPAGRDSAAIQVVPIDDSIAEGTETVVLTLATKTTYGITRPGKAAVSILDND